MPAQQSKSQFNINRALAGHANDATDYGRDFTRLPGGVSGVARLTEAKIGVFKTGDNAGQKFLYLSGSVLEPETAIDTKKDWDPKNKRVVVTSQAVVRVVGRNTSCNGGPLPLCDTKKKDGTVVSGDANVEVALNELRKLGGEDFTADIATEEDLVERLAALKEAAPLFRFSTSQAEPTAQYPTPRVWENWHGGRGLEDYEPPSAAAGTVDHSAAPGRNGSAPPTADQSPAEGLEFGDLDSLAEAAASDGPDSEAAQAELLKLADAAGVGDEVRSAPSWADAPGLIQGAGGTKYTGESEADAGEHEFAKGDICVYFPVDPKTKKPVKKGLDVEVLTSAKVNRTATIKDLATGRPLADPKTKKAVAVSWDLLKVPD